MEHRIRLLLAWAFHAVLLFGGGVLALIALRFICGPLDPMVKASHGTVGFLFGFVFMGGASISHWLFWIVRGKSLLGIVLMDGVQYGDLFWKDERR